MTPERAKEAEQQAKALASYGPWSDQLGKVLTAEEDKYVRSVWDAMDGSACYMDAFFAIQNGRG